MIRFSVLRVAVAAMLALPLSPGSAHDFRHGALSIAHPFIRVDPVCDGGITRAHVMLIVNQGKRADRLVAAAFADGTRGTILASAGPGGAGPRPLAGVDLPAGGRAALMPPAIAIEFPRASNALAPGSAVPGTLHFEHAGVAAVSFMVEAVREPGRACGAAGTPKRRDGGRPRKDDPHAHHEH